MLTMFVCLYVCLFVFCLLHISVQSYLGELQLAIGYQEAQHQVTVVVRHARSLPQLDNVSSGGEEQGKETALDSLLKL